MRIISEEEAKRFREENKVNSEKLDRCARHEFERDKPQMLPKFKCKRCGGVIDAVYVSLYEQGMRHGSSE